MTRASNGFFSFYQFGPRGHLHVGEFTVNRQTFLIGYPIVSNCQLCERVWVRLVVVVISWCQSPSRMCFVVFGTFQGTTSVFTNGPRCKSGEKKVNAKT